jgi:RNA polymerase sigma-70 factor (ECF subfamily)
MTKNVSDAEDLTQDAFIQIFRGLNSFRGDSAFSTWIYRVMVNTVLMTRRKRHLREVSPDESASVDYSPVQREFGGDDSKLMGAVDRVALTPAAKALPEGCRTIFILHEVEGYEHHEIAERLRCSIGNSKSQLHKARLKMKVVGVRQEKNWEKAYTGRLGTKAGGWATRDSCLLRLPAGTSC